MENGAALRVCTKCGAEKPIEEFHRHNRGPSGRRSQCKACRKVDGQQYYIENRPKILVKTAGWAAANSTRRNAAQRARREKNPAVFDERSARYRKAHLDKYRQFAKDDYWRHRDKRLAAAKEWRKRNRVAVAAQKREYREANPERLAALNRNYKARRRGAQGKHTGAEITRIRTMQQDRCAMPYCKKKLMGKGHVDHRVALARGGGNDASNLQILCANCNLEKKDKDELDFLRERGFLI